MDQRPYRARTGLIVALSFTTLALLVLVVFLIGNPSRSTFLTRAKKRQLVATMRMQLHTAVGEEKSAVLADTDDASHEHAERARRALAAADMTREQVEKLIAQGGDREEIELFSDLQRAWETLKQVDSELLSLAVQNTNLKAQRLSSGPAAAAAGQLEAALSSLVEARAASDTGRETARWSFRVMAAVARLHALQGSHIMESSDQQMDGIEAEMDECNQQVLDSFDRLDRVVDASQKATVAAARRAYAELSRLNAEVVRLSRENSNVRSLELSLGRKRVVTAECEDLLAALQAEVDRPTSTATR